VLDLNTLPLDRLFAELTADGSLMRLLEAARDEDLGPTGVPGDLTALVSIEPERMGIARLVARATGVLAGGACIPEALRIFAPDVRADVHIGDGSRIERTDAIATLAGPLQQVLGAERTLLNLIGRMSGIATRTAEFAQLIAGTSARLLDTRKTTPGLRRLEKYSVRCGGGHCHRIGLYDAVLIKDNHIAHVPLGELGAFVQGASDRVRGLRSRGIEVRFIELEVDRLEQLEVVLRHGGCGVQIVLLDNMDCATMACAVRMRDESGVRMKLEASGGVRRETIRVIAETGVDRISVGGLTHQAVSLDVALDIE
jgi:nicotinate-nucleotide pyrophosphorylase (carboxylating)